MDEWPVPGRYERCDNLCEKGPEVVTEMTWKERTWGRWIYGGHADQLSTLNAHNSKEVSRFKSRGLKRHERFNGYTKAFDFLSGRFRHITDRFENCFEAVCVICQYQIENGYDLFDSLIEDSMLYDII
jgi:hypothetical protein